MGIEFWIGSAIVLVLITCFIVVAPFLGIYGDVKGKDEKKK